MSMRAGGRNSTKPQDASSACRIRAIIQGSNSREKGNARNSRKGSAEGLCTTVCQGCIEPVVFCPLVCMVMVVT